MTDEEIASEIADMRGALDALTPTDRVQVVAQMLQDGVFDGRLTPVETPFLAMLGRR